MRYSGLGGILLWTALSSSWAASHHPQEFLATIAGTPQEGPAIVAHYCALCHAPQPLIVLGAPRMGYPQDWTLRRQQGSETLLRHTIEGYHAMPARGGCFECSDAQLALAIAALLATPSKN